MTQKATDGPTEELQAFRESFATLVHRSTDDDVFALAGESGFIGMQVPEEYGGGGVDDTSFAAVAVEELALAGHIGLALAFGTQVAVAIPTLISHAGPEYRAAWLPGLASGDVRIGVAEQAVSCDVTTEGARLHGSAGEVVNGARAELLLIPTSAAEDEHRVALVAADAAGVTRSPVVDPLGVHAAASADIRLDGVEVCGSALLDSGAAEQLWLDWQLCLAVVAVAGARAALGWTVEYVRERKVFGQSVAAFDNTRFALAPIAAELTVVRSFVNQCVFSRAAGTLTGPAVAAARMRASELFCRVADQGLQLHGGYGYMTEYSIARSFADAAYFHAREASDDVPGALLVGDLGL